MINNTFSISQTAKIIGFPGGEKKFFQWLRDNKYLLPDNYPYQKYIDFGWFTMVDKNLKKIRPQRIVPVTVVTHLGVCALERRVLKEFPPCVPCKQNINGK
jgi:phage antirepressor YoqD-like protein